MAVKNLENPIFHLDDPNGGALVGGKVYIYAAGTTNPLDVYKESSLTNVWTQPITLDAYGNAKIWYNQDAKIVAWNSDETINYYTFDNVSPVGGTTTVTGDYNLVQNGSFEADESGAPTNWTITPYDPSVDISVDTTNVAHGKQSLKFDGLAGIGGGTATSSKFDVTSGTWLSVMLSTMASNATTTNDCQVFWYKKDDTASATVSTTLALPASGSYPTSMTEYRFLVSVPSDATRAEIKLTGIDSGGANLGEDCWFDNVLAVDNKGDVPANNLVDPVGNVALKIVNVVSNTYMRLDTTADSAKLQPVSTTTDGHLELLGQADGYVKAAGGASTNERQGIFVCREPTTLLVSSATTGSWVTQLAATGAKIALIKIVGTATGAGASISYTCYLRETGSGRTNDNTTIAVSDTDYYSGGAHTITPVMYATVPCNSSGQFDWYATGTGVTDTSLYIVGYYV